MRSPMATAAGPVRSGWNQRPVINAARDGVAGSTRNGVSRGYWNISAMIHLGMTFDR